MRRYETVIIIDPDVEEDERLRLIERINEIISQHSGFLIKLDDWGQRRMAYEIKKKFRGYYTRLDFCGDGKLVDEIERTFRIDDRVMKYMSVLLEKEADIDAIKEMLKMEKAKKETEKADLKEHQAMAESESSSSQSNQINTTKKD
jgi:small subunit ribosomal protein S6